MPMSPTDAMTQLRSANATSDFSAEAARCSEFSDEVLGNPLEDPVGHVADA